jgi:hypothetical protein
MHRDRLTDIEICDEKSITKWSSSHQGLPVVVLNEIFSYLRGHDMLLSVERTCRYWSQLSQHGIGWYHFNLHEWSSKVISALLNKRLIDRNNAIDSNSSSELTSNGNNSSLSGLNGSFMSSIRSINGKLPSFRDFVALLNRCPRLQYLDLTIDHLSHGDDLSSTIIQLLSTSKLIHLSLMITSLDWHHSSLCYIIIPSIPSLTKLTLKCSQVFMVGIQPMINLRSFHIDANWIPMLGVVNITSSVSNGNENEHVDHYHDRRSLTSEWILPHLVDLTISGAMTPAGVHHNITALITVLVASYNTLRSLKFLQVFGDDEIKVLMNPAINFNSLTSLSLPLFDNPATLFHRFNRLHHLHLALLSSELEWLTLMEYKGLLTSIFSPLIHLSSLTITIGQIVQGTTMETRQTLCDAISSLPSLTIINGQPRDEWILKEKQQGHLILHQRQQQSQQVSH